MKHQFIPIWLIAVVLMISCNTKNKKTLPTEVVSQSTAAPMIIPEAPDTLLSNGRRNIFLVSRRELPGFFVERAIFPPGYKSNPHTHPGNLNITVISGSINLVLGSNPDSTAEAKVYGPGSFIIIPANQSHFEWFTERSVMDITGVGPITTTNIPIIHSSH
jgi:quercetin dioxygenase-like cupin family protein